jgi:hypothetical protein
MWDYPGGAGIISPRGEYLAGPVYGKEDIVYADIDMDMIIRSKAVIDGVGHFSRPDILTLEIKGYDPGKKKAGNGGPSRRQKKSGKPSAAEKVRARS